jgi:hypothetical protein
MLNSRAISRGRGLYEEDTTRGTATVGSFSNTQHYNTTRGAGSATPVSQLKSGGGGGGYNDYLGGAPRTNAVTIEVSRVVNIDGGEDKKFGAPLGDSLDAVCPSQVTDSECSKSSFSIPTRSRSTATRGMRCKT